MATDNHRHAEVGDGQREDQAERGKHGLSRSGPGDAVERPPGACTHARCRVEQTRVTQREGRKQNHQRVGKRVDHLADHDAPKTIDIVCKKAAQQSLVTEQVDQRNGGQHRWRQQRQQRYCAPQALGGNQRALQRVGEHIGQRHHNDRDSQGDTQAVAQQPMEMLAGQQLSSCGKSAALPHVVAEAAPEDSQQGQKQRHRQNGEKQYFPAEYE